MQTRTNPELFIIESLTLEDEKNGYQEGDIISRMLQLTGKERTRYYYIRTARELKKIIALFGQSQYRYLHISCHANKSDFGTTFDTVQYAELGDMLRPHLCRKRVFVSACEMVNKSLAKELFNKSGLLSLIGPSTKIHPADAAAFWVSFYHLMFKTEDRKKARKMTTKELRKRINQLSKLYGVWMPYFAKKGNSGFKSLPVHRPISASRR